MRALEQQRTSYQRRWQRLSSRFRETLRALAAETLRAEAAERSARNMRRELDDVRRRMREAREYRP